LRIALIFLFCAQFFFPQQSQLSKTVNNISEFIASSKYINSKNNLNDLHIIDSIYSLAIVQTDYDYSEALMALTFATVPYKAVPIQIPVIKTIIDYPLVSTSDSIFDLKNENLPRYIFFDSPPNDYGDKDKLAHFFGCAFISFSSKIFDLGNTIGYFIEVFEETFKVQSSIDERDLMTNTFGNIFGRLLRKNKNILPSQILVLRTLSNFNCSI
jgi:hypothetical protein